MGAENLILSCGRKSQFMIKLKTNFLFFMTLSYCQNRAMSGVLRVN